MISDELKTWRRQQRDALLAARVALPQETITVHRLAIDRHLRLGFPGLTQGVIAFCWPYQNEYDARFLLRGLRERGAVTALPVVVAPRSPLAFREWHPGVALSRGVYGIPYPVDSAELLPDTVLLPMLGVDEAGYRLGYGGGYFDRTLAALACRPTVIGTAYEMARIATIYPQPHDIPVDWVVTERGIYRRDPGRLAFLGPPPGGEGSALSSPVCYGNQFEAPTSEGG